MKIYQQEESSSNEDFFQSDENSNGESTSVETTTFTSDEKLVDVNNYEDSINVETSTSDDSDKVVESGTLGVDIQVEISDYEYSPKDNLYTSDFNSLDSDDRKPLVISSGEPVQDPDTQKRSSPEIAESHSGSSAKITGTFSYSLLIMSTLLFIRF